jgi:hypothetical protein
MKIANFTETKHNLSTLIDGLNPGSPVLIVDRGDRCSAARCRALAPVHSSSCSPQRPAP